MKKQLFKIHKNDWAAVVRNLTGETYFYDRTRAGVLELANSWAKPGAKVQIFKLSYEFKDAFVVPEKLMAKGKK